MATAKRTIDKTQRAAQDSFQVLPQVLPDGRFVIISPKAIHLANIEQCSCGDYRFQKAENRKPCKHMIRLGASPVTEIQNASVIDIVTRKAIN